VMAEGDKRAKLATAALEQDWLADAPVTIVLLKLLCVGRGEQEGGKC